VVNAVRFEPGHDEFSRTLRARVDAYFVASGTDAHADAWMMGKTLSMFGVLVIVYVAIVAASLSAWPSLALCVVLGVMMAMVGFNVGHDAVHGSISSVPIINRVCALVFDVFGASSENWSVAHNIDHHTWTNVPGHDVDIEPGKLLRFHPHHPTHAWHRYQHFYGPVLYGLAFVAWVFAKDFKQALLRNVNSGRHPPAGRLMRVMFFKLVHVTLYLAVPMAISPWSGAQIACGYFTCLVAAGLPIALVFQLPHIGEKTAFFKPVNQVLPGSFAAHQLRTTANFAVDSKFWTFITGGQNHQIEHHLMPKICHTHLPRLAPIVAATAQEFGLPYHVYPSFTAALASHVRQLRRFGQGRS
jgi:linoleoyl-CoA desaturase